MPITTREQLQRRRERVEQLLHQGISVRAISQRTGMTERNVHRVKKALQERLGVEGR